MSRAHMCTHIVEEQAQLEAIDQNRLTGRPAKKAHAQSEQQAARGNKERSGSRSCSGPVDNAIELRNEASVPSPAAARFSMVRSASWVLPAANFPEFVVLTSAARWSLTRTIVR